MGKSRSVVQQVIKECPCPGTNYLSECPSCGDQSEPSCLPVNPVEDPASICPGCGNSKGDYTFKKCHPAKVIISGEVRYFCVTSLLCSDCRTLVWNRVRIAAMCDNCKLRFDFAMNREVICRLKGEEVITQWKQIKERDKSHGKKRGKEMS